MRLLPGRTWTPISADTGSTPAARDHRLSEVDEEAATAWCSGCGARVEITRSKRYWVCAVRNRQRAAGWRRANPGADATAKAARKAADPKAWSKQRKAAAGRYFEAHRQELRDQRNAKREQLRAEAIAAYGGRCACPGCHVIHAQLLTIDHINGGGNAHRRSIGRGSRDFYAWLKRNGYPPDFQALCGSCNLAKSDKDKCPLAGQEH
jgi:hypothetical protein